MCKTQIQQPGTCISYPTAFSAVGASIGCKKITWLAAVKFVPHGRDIKVKRITELSSQA